MPHIDNVQSAVSARSSNNTTATSSPRTTENKGLYSSMKRGFLVKPNKRSQHSSTFATHGPFIRCRSSSPPVLQSSSTSQPRFRLSESPQCYLQQEQGNEAIACAPAAAVNLANDEIEALLQEAEICLKNFNAAQQKCLADAMGYEAVIQEGNAIEQLYRAAVKEIEAFLLSQRTETPSQNTTRLEDQWENLAKQVKDNREKHEASASAIIDSARMLNATSQAVKNVIEKMSNAKTVDPETRVFLSRSTVNLQKLEDYLIQKTEKLQNSRQGIKDAPEEQCEDRQKFFQSAQVAFTGRNAAGTLSEQAHTTECGRKVIATLKKPLENKNTQANEMKKMEKEKMIFESAYTTIDEFQAMIQQQKQILSSKNSNYN